MHYVKLTRQKREIKFSYASEVFCNSLSTNAAPPGLRSVRSRFSIEIPSLRDSRGFWSFQGLRVESGSVGKPNLPDLELRRLFFLKLTVMVRLQTAPTGPGENTELPKYFLKLHQTAPTGPGAN